jgi:hypothetical protein
MENNKLKERIKMLEEHVCIMSTNRSSSNSSGPNQQIVDKLTDGQKDILTKWINSYVWRTNKLPLPENGTWQKPEFERLMFDKLEVDSDAMKIIVWKQCYKILMQTINQKIANLKLAVYRKYLSKRMRVWYCWMLLMLLTRHF